MQCPLLSAWIVISSGVNVGSDDGIKVGLLEVEGESDDTGASNSNGSEQTNFS